MSKSADPACCACAPALQVEIGYAVPQPSVSARRAGAGLWGFMLNSSGEGGTCVTTLPAELPLSGKDWLKDWPWASRQGTAEEQKRVHSTTFTKQHKSLSWTQEFWTHHWGKFVRHCWSPHTTGVSPGWTRSSSGWERWWSRCPGPDTSCLDYTWRPT